MSDLIFIDPVVPLMLTPEPVSEVADEALYGMAATLVGEAAGKYRVRMRYRYEGYVDPAKVLSDVSAAEWEEKAAWTVEAPMADIMSGPAYRSVILKTLPRGALLIVDGENPARDEQGAKTKWLPATLVNGLTGYVRTDSVRPVRTWQVKNEQDEELRRACVVEDALKYLGTQYRWGGKTPAGIDCSGLAAMACMLNGLYIYRDARIVDGFPVREIPASRARPADLLFWPGHVAVYLGEGDYVHANGLSSSVTVNSLNPEKKNFRGDLAAVEKWGSVFADL